MTRSRTIDFAAPRRGAALLLAVGVSACSFASTAGLTRSPSSPPAATGAGGSLVVPDVRGKTEAQARALARAAGFSAEVELNPSLFCGDAPRDTGRVRCQSPDPGRRVPRGAWIQIAVDAPQAYAGVLYRDQLKPLVGMTIEDAKQYLRSLGHDGPIRLSPMFSPGAGCRDGTVCSIDREGGLGIHDEVLFAVNPQPETAAPRP